MVTNRSFVVNGERISGGRCAEGEEEEGDGGEEGEEDDGAGEDGGGWCGGGGGGERWMGLHVSCFRG